MKKHILRRKLLAWFSLHQRSLPWRETNNPYFIVVSEIMLQQTQVDRVIPKYQAFLERFPTWEVLATAPQSEVVRLWSGLGYNRRALNLQALARAVVERGSFPEDPADMLELPGIGPYTSQAVAAFAFRRPKSAPVDTNIERVLGRIFGVRGAKRQDMARLAQEVAPTDVWTWNHALMDFGATVCLERRPQCEICPMKDICEAYPCDGTDSQKVKQAKFAGSDRFYRGQLLLLVRDNSVLRRNDVLQKLQLTDVVRANRIIDGLICEGFILEDKDGKLSLKD